MKYDWEFTSVKLYGVYANRHGMGFRLDWDSFMGFGELSFDVENGKLTIDSETLGREEVMKILAKFVESGRLLFEKETKHASND